MNCFFERFNKVSVCLCKSATEPLRRVRIIATAIALVLLILIPPAGGQELQLIDNLHVRPSHRSKKNWIRGDILFKTGCTHKRAALITTPITNYG
jgi:hypothetical protein